MRTLAVTVFFVRTWFSAMLYRMFSHPHIRDFGQYSTSLCLIILNSSYPSSSIYRFLLIFTQNISAAVKIERTTPVVNCDAFMQFSMWCRALDWKKLPTLSVDVKEFLFLVCSACNVPWVELVRVMTSKAAKQNNSSRSPSFWAVQLLVCTRSTLIRLNRSSTRSSLSSYMPDNRTNC